MTGKHTRFGKFISTIAYTNVVGFLRVGYLFIFPLLPRDHIVVLGVVHHGCVPSVRFRYLKLQVWIVLWWRQFPLPCKLCALQRWPSNLVLWQRTSRCVTVGIHRSTRWNRHAVFWSNRHVHSSRFCVSRRPRTFSSSLAPRIGQAC